MASIGQQQQTSSESEEEDGFLQSSGHNNNSSTLISNHCPNASSIFFDYLFQSTECRQLPLNKQQLLRHYFNCFASSRSYFGSWI